MTRKTHVKIYLNESDTWTKETCHVLMAEIGIDLPTVVKCMLVGEREIGIP